MGLLNRQGSAPVALCRSCESPLIGTMAWSKYEFYCVECGAHLGWLEPLPGDPTPELDARYDALKAEWVELGGEDLLGGGQMLRDCETCTKTREPHLNHASEDEVARHQNALHNLKERASSVRA